MRREELRPMIEALGFDHQVFRIIQLDRRSGVAKIPDAEIFRLQASFILFNGTTEMELEIS